MKRRSHIGLKTKLAATLCSMLRPDAEGHLVPVITYTEAKALTEDQILSLFHFDHYPVPKENRGPDTHYNLVPRPIMEHRRKTAEIDTPARAKSRSLSEKHEQFRRRLLAKAGQGEAIPRKKSRWPKRKMRSR